MEKTTELLIENAIQAKKPCDANFAHKKVLSFLWTENCQFCNLNNHIIPGEKRDIIFGF